VLEDEKAEWTAKIAEANQAATTTKAVMENVVIDARRAGMTWVAIAAALGVSRQAATERFNRFPEIEEAQIAMMKGSR
jgi:hypothetical protein